MTVYEECWCFDCIIEYVSNRLGQSFVTSTLSSIVHSVPVTSPSDSTSEWLIYLVLIVLFVSIAIIISAIIYIVCIRICSRRSAPGKYTSVSQGSRTDAVVAPATSPILESTNAAATTVAGSDIHVFTPNVQSPQPFKGYLTPETQV